MIRADVVVVGAGPAGLAAAAEAALNGADRVIVIERNPEAGGILNQCIHDGFGLYRYGAALSGPEYAAYARNEAVSSGAELICGATVLSVSEDLTLSVASREGLLSISAGAVVLATGCRERTRSALMIPGDRPAGVFTAGTAQELMNLRGLTVGRNAVILGSGDVGLIAARRMTLNGMKVKAICEAGKTPTGLSRNIRQCAMDLNIPILTGTTVGKILGRKRLEGVELCDADENMRPIWNTARFVACDTLVLSVGLIPERELISGLEVPEDGSKGIFLCGNCRRIQQLADMASEDGAFAGKRAAEFAKNRRVSPQRFPSPPVLPTGFPPRDSFICTGCPRGCTVTKTGSGFLGNMCLRGEALASEELSDPKRMLTLTLKSEKGKWVSLRSAGPISLSVLEGEAKRLMSERVAEENAVPGKKSGLTAGGRDMIVTGISPFGPGRA